MWVNELESGAKVKLEGVEIVKLADFNHQGQPLKTAECVGTEGNIQTEGESL